jgi:hypothetical protein
LNLHRCESSKKKGKGLQAHIHDWNPTIHTSAKHYTQAIMSSDLPFRKFPPQENDPWINASHALLDCKVCKNLARGVLVPDACPWAAFPVPSFPIPPPSFSFPAAVIGGWLVASLSWLLLCDVVLIFWSESPDSACACMGNCGVPVAAGGNGSMSSGRGNGPGPTPIPGRGEGCAELGAVLWALSVGELDDEA